MNAGATIMQVRQIGPLVCRREPSRTDKKEKAGETCLWFLPGSTSRGLTPAATHARQPPPVVFDCGRYLDPEDSPSPADRRPETSRVLTVPRRNSAKLQTRRPGANTIYQQRPPISSKLRC
ncbi:hypothetical protein ACMFMG_012185 [Clarireedia jacksonii]